MQKMLQDWFIVVFIVFVVYTLAIVQIDLYAPTLDEFYSLNNAGGVVDTPYSPAEILASLQEHSPQHTPGYFLLLSVWGNAVSWDIAIVRLITVFAGLLSVAMSYRLARDFTTPLGGLIVAIVIASNTFYNFYYAHVRMYPFLVLFASIVLWLYLRLRRQNSKNRLVDYGALMLASYVLINTHILSVVFFGALGIYHVLFVRKDRAWWGISIAVTLAMMLFSPYLVVTFSGFGHAVDVRDGLTVDGFRAIEVWLTIAFNNNVTLLGLVLVGVYFAWRNKTLAVRSYLLILPIYLILLGIVAQFGAVVMENGMRYLVAGFAPLMLFIGVGLVGLIRHSRWTLILVLLWVIAGMSFQRSVGNWNQYIADRFIAFSATPFHGVSRDAQQETIKPFVMGYQNVGDSFFRDGRFDVAFIDYFFRQYDIRFSRFQSVDDAVTRIEQHSVTRPSIWLTYRHGDNVEQDIEQIQRALAENYIQCDTQNFGVNSVIEKYVWDFLECQLPTLELTDATEMVDYGFYTANMIEDSERLWFVDEWTAVTDDLNLNMSYQLLTADWQNVAQLDLPLVHEGELRRFALDIGSVPAGTYRLVTVLYDPNTGDRQDWIHITESPRDVLTLTEIVIR